MASSTTQKTEIPDATQEEKAMMEMMTDALMPSYLQESGYDVKKSQETYQDTTEYKNFSDQRTRIQEEKAGLEAQLENVGASTTRTGSTGQKRNEIMKKISDLNGKLDKIDKKEQDFLDGYDPKITYDVRKMQSPEVEAERRKLVEQYGDVSDSELMKLSPEYKDLYETAEQRGVDKATKERELAETYMEKTKKFLDGDFSIDESQKALIQQNMAPIRAAVDKMFESAKTGSAETSLFAAVKKTFDDFESRVKETGMNLMDGLETVGKQVQQTGVDMEGALKNTIGVHKELLKMGIEDFTGQVTKQIASSAAMQGRSPDDPEYTSEITQQVSRQVKEGQLNLAAMEAQGMLAIKERTGSGLEDVARQKVGVTERTGGLMEQSALQRGMQNEELVRSKGSADIGLEETAANLRWQVGAGMPPSQVGLAQGIDQWNQAQAQQRISNASSAMYAGMPFVQYMQQERAYEPTTTTTTNPGVGGIFSGIIGAASAGAQIYSGIGQANAMGTMANSYNARPPGT